ncbi:hypothetical protein ACFP1I_07220 [Dyadobacter subterraneus]|uniref:3-oxoacyl-ACP synthase n=1 Tax=Dyadobacter subterraneus TaxID=2773304 RepID=A0ABR9WF09_9BACT|nr:hypothetical protein [Dyadobacter subterraneus]MBE9464078.1 hypothetical protein [Dyadobacter subterraneus]
MSFITAYCHINENSCSVNGEVILLKNEESADSWFKQLYKELALEYPKFYKMDMLSQAGFLGSELIKKANPDLISNYKDDEIALLFANSESSADTDIRFKESYQDKKTPSPSLFVYTLPNIVLGEIAIRNKWFGENMFAVLPKFTPDFYVQYGTILLNTGSKAVLAGWLGILEGQVEVFMFLIQNGNSNGKPFDKENVIKYAGF